MSQTPDWALIGAVVSGFALLATLVTLGVVIYDVFRPERRARKFRQNPGASYFIIPRKAHHTCLYALQDEEEHWAKEIVIPPHSESVIDISVVPSIDFTTSEIILACQEMGALEKLERRPHITEIFNRFIKVGPRRHVVPGRPGVSEYIDKYNSFHTVEDRRWSVGTTRALGFKIKTKDAGRFNLSMFFTGEAIEARLSDLVINVSEINNKTFVHCVQDSHRHLYCVAGIRPRALDISNA